MNIAILLAAGKGARIVQQQLFADHHPLVQVFEPGSVAGALGHADGRGSVFDQLHVLEGDGICSGVVQELVELAALLQRGGGEGQFPLCGFFCLHDNSMDFLGLCGNLRRGLKGACSPSQGGNLPQPFQCTKGLGVCGGQ